MRDQTSQATVGDKIYNHLGTLMGTVTKVNPNGTFDYRTLHQAERRDQVLLMGDTLWRG